MPPSNFQGPVSDLDSFLTTLPAAGHVSSERINDIRYINRYLEKVNSTLENGDLFVGYFETFSARRARMWVNRIFLLRGLYFGFEFLFKRVLPKIKYLNEIYFAITKGKNRLLSKAEVMGRLVCCGFQIEKVLAINGITFFAVRKVKEPVYQKSKNYGLILKIKRIGQAEQLFNVYKIRTMHPFSEFLQEYMIAEHGFSEKGKLKDDFRLTPWGRILRRYWLDELPQLYNILKGDMKLVGIRPVSEKYYQLLPEQLRQRRKQHKPGCVPPYLALGFKSTVKNVLKAELIYTIEKKKNPRLTDTKYFFKALYYIIFRRFRSS